MMDEKKLPILGILSTALSLLANFGIVIIVVIAGIVGANTNGEINDQTTATMIGLGALAMPLLNLVSLGLGVGGLFQPNTSKVLSIIGIVISLVGIAVMVSIIVLGLFIQARGG